MGVVTLSFGGALISASEQSGGKDERPSYFMGVGPLRLERIHTSRTPSYR